MEIKNQVRKFREEKDITQEELAKELDVSRQTINAIETGKYNPSLELALEVANFFNTEVEEVFCLEE
jgi:putative transcriptional regulator